MTDPDATARKRYFLLTGVRIAGAAGAMLGLLLIGRAQATGPKLLGTALVLAALLMMAIVPRGLARRWRTPPER